VRPSASFVDENAYNQALLDKCVELGIEIIAITDHWCVDTAGTLIDSATDRGIAALPGFEANSSEAVHLLVIFEAGTALADVTAAIGECGGTPGCDNGTTGVPLHELLAKMAKRGALVIPAHVNVAKAGLFHRLEGTPLVNAVTDPYLHAVAVTPSQPSLQAQDDVIAGRNPYARKHPLAVIYADDVSDPATLEGLGAATWFKLSSRSLSSIKHAVRTPDTRIALDDPNSAHRPVIREISWSGGFLDGVSIPIAEDLTTLIGGRGTGKSTVIESLRHVLGIEPAGAAAKKDHLSIVNDVLGPGATVRVVIDTVTPTPATFIIERTLPNPAVVRDSAGTATQQRPEDLLGRVEVFGQHELAELASDPSSVANMLQRFAGSTGPSSAYLAVCGQLAQNRQDLATAEQTLATLDDELSDIPRLEAHEARYKETDLPGRLAEQTQLDRDEAAFSDARQRVEDVRSAFNEVALASGLDALTESIDGVGSSPNSEHLERAAAALTTLSTALADAIIRATAAVDSAAEDIAAATGAWTTATTPQREGHAQLVRDLIKEGHDPANYLDITKRLAALRTKASKRPAAEARITELQGARTRLIGELAGHETQQSKDLNAAVGKANDKTSGVVVVKPIAAPDRRHIKEVIEDHVKGARTQIMSAIDQPTFSPRALAVAARTGAADLESFDIRGAQATNLANAGEACFRHLEELTVGHAVDVRLDISGGSAPRQYRSIKQLSKGQRATALLLLLLGASEAPLIIDQPEDDLDNRFVYEGIVAKLRELKGQRQIIVSTHNANVPVLGDAELIVTLDGDGNRGWPVEGGVGSLDDEPIRRIAENLLEGGSTAFNARYHLYGF
jgi:DNA repair ATPase RecN